MEKNIPLYFFPVEYAVLFVKTTKEKESAQK